MAFYPEDGFSKDFRAFEPPAAVVSIQVEGVDIVPDTIFGTADVDTLATNIETEINGHTSSPNYTARAVDSRVYIIAPEAGTKYNGYEVAVEAMGGVRFTGVLNLNGGTDPEFLPDTEPGHFVKTYGSKMYTVSGPALHFSGIGQPTIFSTEAVGAGFIDMTTYSSGAENLVALENYFGRMAVFSENVVQLWTLDPDPDLNQQEQVVRNVGTRSPRSVLQVGETDLFFLDSTGIMTLRPHGVTTEAQAENASLAIDDVVLEAMDDAGDSGVRNAISAIEPKTKRFWMAIGSKIFVLSRYPGAKIAAWSVYDTPTGAPVDDMVVYDDRLYLRVGNDVYLYGGSDGNQYGGDYEVTVRIPYLDAQRPADWKMWRQVTLAAEGEWTATVYTDPDSIEEEDAPVDIEGVNYGKRRVPLQANSSHLSLKLVHEAAGYARISNLSVHYESSESG